MSRAAFSAKVFAVYLFLIGPLLVLAPNFLLSIFGIASATEVWIRVVGLIAFMLGVYVWVSATHEFRPFLEASVYTRFVVFLALSAFAILDLGSPMIALFGFIDLAGGVWTYLALRADARLGRPILAAQ